MAFPLRRVVRRYITRVRAAKTFQRGWKRRNARIHRNAMQRFVNNDIYYNKYRRNPYSRKSRLQLLEHRRMTGRWHFRRAQPFQ